MGGQKVKTILSPDLLADHPISAIFVALIGFGTSLLNVNLALIYGAVALFIINSAVTVVYSFKSSTWESKELARATALRLFVYIAAGFGIVIISNMGRGDEAIYLREAYFKAVAGVELAFVFAMAARISERFKPIWLWLRGIFEKFSPVDLNEEHVEQTLNNN